MNKPLRVFFLALAVFYVGVLLFWGRHDLGRVAREYRQATAQLSNGFALARAEGEVASGCRQTVGGESAPGYGDCLRASAPVIQKRAAVISGELRRERRQVVKKLLLFAVLVGGVLIVLPLALLYGLMTFLLYLLRNIRFAKE